MISVKDLEMGRRAWITQVGSNESLKEKQRSFSAVVRGWHDSERVGPPSFESLLCFSPQYFSPRGR